MAIKGCFSRAQPPEHVHVCVHVYMFVPVYVHGLDVHVCMQAFMCMCICMCMYIDMVYFVRTTVDINTNRKKKTGDFSFIIGDLIDGLTRARQALYH